MSDETVNRVVAEAALARRHENEINKRASKATIPTLVADVKRLAPPGEGGAASPIALDTDGVPYLTIGD